MFAQRIHDENLFQHHLLLLLRHSTVSVKFCDLEIKLRLLVCHFLLLRRHRFCRHLLNVKWLSNNKAKYSLYIRSPFKSSSAWREQKFSFFSCRKKLLRKLDWTKTCKSGEPWVRSKSQSFSGLKQCRGVDDNWRRWFMPRFITWKIELCRRIQWNLSRLHHDFWRMRVLRKTFQISLVQSSCFCVGGFRYSIELVLLKFRST